MILLMLIIVYGLFLLYCVRTAEEVDESLDI
ncbi:hypothetical protein SAMN04488574_102213 [Bacillus sp. 71mf]|nr:hypothetical protein SAMN04488574_102213 [Bacillus sp. 71mf]SFS39590.1 hypothetical protein SAMN04488145_101253 [Bacillus sp. 103mf]